MIYDLVIIGAGPAGLNASIYASRYGIKNLVIGGVLGGLVSEAADIGNWLGDKAIKGSEFAMKITSHAQSYGTEIKYDNVKTISKKEEIFEIELAGLDKVLAKSIILATGTTHKELGVKGEKEFAGKGISRCATCDGFFYKGKVVAVVGGGDSALEDASYLSELADKVYLIHRRDEFRAEEFWKNKVLSNPKIQIIYNAKVAEFKGSEKLEEVILDIAGEKKEIKVDGVFIAIGFEPKTEFIDELGLEKDDDGYIKINNDGSTNIAGFYAAGDITTGSNKFKQIITAASEGAVAANSANIYLKKK